jgi:hypothetical protein
MGLDAATLDKLRALHKSTLSGACDIWRKTKTLKADGGVSESWAKVGAGLPCRLMPEAGARATETLAQREAMVAYYRLTLPHDADLQPDDRVEVAGGVYQVLTLWDQHTFITAKRARLARVA